MIQQAVEDDDVETTAGQTLRRPAAAKAKQLTSGASLYSTTWIYELT